MLGPTIIDDLPRPMQIPEWVHGDPDYLIVKALIEHCRDTDNELAPLLEIVFRDRKREPVEDVR